MVGDEEYLIFYFDSMLSPISIKIPPNNPWFFQYVGSVVCGLLSGRPVLQMVSVTALHKS